VDLRRAFVTGRQALDLAEVRRLARSGEARRIRVDSGLSESEIAAAVGVSTAAISRWETALRRPTGRAALAYRRLLVKLMESQRL
jgi:DNA-binding transcriptional regulator YiaG